MQSSILTNKIGTGAYEQYLGFQAQSNAKILFENENKIKSNNVKLDKKKIMSARRNKDSKSPLDMVDYTHLTKPTDEPNFSKFMNQSSS